MMRMARLTLGAVVVGLAVTVGCFFTNNLDASETGQGGATTSTGGTGGSIPCSPASPCEDVDNNPCTKESCFKGSCVSIPRDPGPGPGSTECITLDCGDNGALPKKTIHTSKACGMGLMCSAQGECAGCTNVAQCGPMDECQKSTCRKDMTCTYEYMPLGTKVNAVQPNDLPDDCKAPICDGYGKTVLFIDMTDTPASAVCTVGQCVDGKPEQTPLPAGTACADKVTYCNASQMCVACALDANCAMGLTCYQETGCVSCADGKKNGDETDSDCGGSCQACADKQGCAQNKDCTSQRCDNGTCISCSDGVRNGGEAAVDCGGATCLACPGIGCSVSGECSLGHCIDTVCCEKACTDPCKSCNLPGKAGLCSDAPLGLADPACPSGTPVCQAGGCVDDMNKNPLGATCGANNDCFSGNCQGSPKTCK